MFKVFIKASFVISDGKGKFINFVELSKMVEKTSQWITRKLREYKGEPTSYGIMPKQSQKLRWLVRRYWLSNPKGVFEFIKLINWYNKEVRPIQKDEKGRPQEWEELYPDHCYALILEQLGFDAFTLKPLKDMCRDVYYGWSRHHMDENILYIFADKLSLHSHGVHGTIGKSKKNPLQFKRDFARILYNRRTMIELIQLDKQIITENDLPAKFKSHFSVRGDMLLWIESRNNFKQQGEKYFFGPKSLYKGFYMLFQNKIFWNTHFLSKP